MKWTLPVLPLVLFLACGMIARADDRVEVGVTFEVKGDHYTDNIGGANLPKLAADAGAAIVAALEDHIKFVDFTTDTAAPYKLAVKLAPAAGNNVGSMVEYGFHLTLRGTDVPPNTSSYVTFRPADRYYEPIGDIAALTREIKEAFNQMDHRAFVTKLMSEISIADSGEFRKDVTSWIIARDRVALCIGYQTLLKVKSEVPFGNGVRYEWFVARVIDVSTEPTRIFAETQNDPASNVQLLRDADETRVKVQRVAVSDYLLCQAPISASDVDFSGMGDSQ